MQIHNIFMTDRDIWPKFHGLGWTIWMQIQTKRTAQTTKYDL